MLMAKAKMATKQIQSSDTNTFGCSGLHPKNLVIIVASCRSKGEQTEVKLCDKKPLITESNDKLLFSFLGFKSDLIKSD